MRLLKASIRTTAPGTIAKSAFKPAFFVNDSLYDLPLGKKFPALLGL
jgi:hypothetical protein